MNIWDKSVKGFPSYDRTSKQTPTQTNKQRIQLYILDQMKFKFLVLKGMNIPKKSTICVVTSFKLICSNFVDGHRRFLHHQPVDGLLLCIYIPVLFWIKNLVNYGSNEPGKKYPPPKTCVVLWLVFIWYDIFIIVL